MRWLSSIQWDGNQRYPLSTGCDEIDLKVSPPTASSEVLAVQPFTGLQEVRHYRNATLAGQRKKSWRIASPDLTVTGGQRPCTETELQIVEFRRASFLELV